MLFLASGGKCMRIWVYLWTHSTAIILIILILPFRPTRLVNDIQVHVACQAMRNGDCEAALVGSADLLLSSHSLKIRESAGIT